MAVIAAYDRALVTVNRDQRATAQLSDVAADAWVEQLVREDDGWQIDGHATQEGRC